MHLHRKAIYRTESGNVYQYVGVCPGSLFKGQFLTFRLVQRNSFARPSRTVIRNVNELHSPGHWMRGLKLIGKNYADTTQ